MNNRMTTFTPQKAYLLIGLALIAQYLVSALASNLIFMPYADPEKLQNLVKIISPTGFLLLMYVPRVIGVIVFWLIARIVPFERKAGSKIGFGSIMQLFFIMYAVSSVFNAIGTGIKMLSPADAASQTDQLSDIIATGNIGGFVIVLMLAPIFEEIVFRKLILDRVSKYGEANAILFSAICLFMTFKEINISNNQVVNWYAASAFSIYLVHDNVYFRRLIANFVSSQYTPPFVRSYGIMLILSLGIVLFVPLIDKLRIMITNPICNYLCKAYYKTKPYLIRIVEG